MTRVAVYARLSLAVEESVSIDRQLDAGRKYAESRGWDIALEAVDDGVSATRYAPERRPGWRQVLAAAPGLDAVVVWKTDRLCRSVSDFVRADEALSRHGAGIVAVEDPIDMTTPQGRAFALVLAVFAELEAKMTAARVRAARTHVLLNDPGRAVGGQRPWPYRAVDRDDGPGKRWEPIPERADAIRQAARDVIDGASVASVARAWTDAGLLPDPKRRGGNLAQASWSVKAVGRLLRNPTLFGAVIFDGEPLREPDGTTRIDPSRVIIALATWRRLQAALDRPGGRPRGSRRGRALLAGLAACGACGRPLSWVQPTGKPAIYRCTALGCYTSASAALLEQLVTKTFLDELGDHPMTELAAAPEPDSAELAAVAEALEACQAALDADPGDDEALRLLQVRRDLRGRLAALQAAGSPEPGTLGVLRRSGETYAEAWEDPERRPELLQYAFRRVVVGRGERGGRRPLVTRVTFERD